MQSQTYPLHTWLIGPASKGIASVIKIILRKSSDYFFPLLYLIMGWFIGKTTQDIKTSRSARTISCGTCISIIAIALYAFAIMASRLI
ncbi:hypothetical protein [Erwinia phyllosphaerae]|uniref:hypothetical protein n=1 Tax=Erwinia phyllosphaerae TaxID=2853256 RepID=UPI001FEEFC13|nr:hypothetical protein [Erwinia phyllosphaerae]